MSLVFLVFTNLVLITRLCCQMQEGGVNWRLWGTKMVVELLGLALFEWHSWLLAAAATVVIMNVAGVLWEALGWRRNAGHFTLGVVYLLALSVWFSPAFGLKFWPAIESAFAGIGQWTAFEAIFQSSFSTTAMLALFGLLVAMSEMNLAVRAVFDYLNLKPRAASDSEEVDVVAYDRGRAIGFLERALIYFFVLGGHYDAVGFVLVAKAFAHIRHREDRISSEYVMIGTLMSAGLAIAVGELVNHLSVS
ncbi:MAG: hypothetical protein WC485_07475 [Opitutaceae bacterium]